MEDLRAFSTYFKHPTNYKVSVYVNGTFILSQNGYSDAGYYTIPFNEKITLHRGDEFTIMVENHNSGENLFPVCQAKEVNMVNFNPNTSFVSYDGRNWFDLYNLQNYADFLYGGIKSNTCQVACIKAFTSIQNLSNTIRIDIDKFESVNLNEKIKITVSLKREDIINKLNHLDNHVFTLNINGKNYYALINDAKASFEISFDNAGDYVLSAQYKDNIFISNTVKFNFKVNKKNSLLYVGSLSKVYGGSENALVTLKDDSGNAISNAEITFNLNGKSIKVRTNSNGQASIPVDAAPKTYTATVTFAGGGNYNGASAKINIVVKKTSSKITAKKASIKAKKTKKYTIVLKDNYGKAIKKVNVVLKVKGKTFKAKTSNNGKATFKLKLPKKGSFKATIKFSGNAYYNSVTKKVKIIVK